MNRLWISIVLLSLGCGAVGEPCTEGSEGCECIENACFSDLTCLSGYCVRRQLEPNGTDSDMGTFTPATPDMSGPAGIANLGPYASCRGRMDARVCRQGLECQVVTLSNQPTELCMADITTPEGCLAMEGSWSKGFKRCILSCDGDYQCPKTWTCHEPGKPDGHCIPGADCYTDTDCGGSGFECVFIRYEGTRCAAKCSGSCAPTRASCQLSDDGGSIGMSFGRALVCQ